MKKTFLLKGILVLFAVAPLLAGCKNDEQGGGDRYLKLSDVSFTFQKDGGGEGQIVTVKSNPQWSIDSETPWLHISDETTTSFKIVADKNEGVERAAVITVTAGELMQSITVKQLGEDGQNARYRLMSAWKNAVVSPNGKYFAGVIVDLAKDGSIVYNIAIGDIETEDMVIHGPFPESLYQVGNATSVTDNGTVYVQETSGGSVEIKLNGENRKMEVPEGTSGSVQVVNASADGSVLVGYASGGVGKNNYVPVKIENGISTILPIPEKNYREGEWYYGILARGCSADGSIIYGTSWENLMINDQGLAYWDKDGVHWVGEDVHKLSKALTLEDGLGNPYNYNLYNGMTSNGASNKLMSPNGKWIAGTYRTENLADDGQSIVYELYPAFYNTETKKTTIFMDMKDCIGLTASDEGVGFAGKTMPNNGVATGVSDGVALDIETATKIGTYAEWIRDNYGITVPSNGYVSYVCAGGKVIMGGITITDAALDGGRHVNWYVAPPVQR